MRCCRWSQRGVAIVGLEPSCLLGLRDEFLDYGFGEDAQLLAANAMMFEEFSGTRKSRGQADLHTSVRHRLPKPSCTVTAIRRRSG